MDSNFPGTNSIEQFLGVVEEVGELSHALLKLSQGIRGKPSKLREDSMDAVGDIMIFLMGFCNEMQWDLDTILNTTWDHVAKRNWVNNPLTGEEN